MSFRKELYQPKHLPFVQYKSERFNSLLDAWSYLTSIWLWKKTNGLPRALLPKGVTTSNQVLDSRKSCQVTFPSAAALQGKQPAGNGHYEFTPQNNDDAFLFSERLKCNPSTANVEHKSDYGSVGCHKHNTLHFMAPAKGVMLVGLIEGVPYLKAERCTTQILWRTTWF